MNSCPHIDQAVRLTESEGNKVLSISKSELMDCVVCPNVYGEPYMEAISKY